MVSSPGGRIAVVNPDGDYVRDKDGHPAFSELYSENVWREAESDMDSDQSETRTINPLFGQPRIIKSQNIFQYLRSKHDVVKPQVEGTIDFEDRPQEWTEKGFKTIKTFTADIDGKSVLLPLIINEKEVSTKKAIEHYKKTGEHFGIFKNKDEASKYKTELHKRLGLIESSNEKEIK
jgi:hypothetical protein